jgi:glycosyltransferase involved in cell wall biosynthesis
MLSIVINTFNEQDSILECIESAKLLSADILVVDMESTDKTIELAKKLGCHILTFPFSHYVEPARKFGIEKSKGDWIFILDADERMTKELAEEIKRTILKSSHSYFEVPRRNIFANKKWLKFGGWYPDYQKRLIKKTDFVDWPERIHSSPQIKGTLGKLNSDIIHLFHPRLDLMVEKTILFEGIESDLLFNANKPVKVSTFFRKYFGELYRRLLKNKGYRDGIYGIIESVYQAYSKTITYLYLYEKYLKKNHRI